MTKKDAALSLLGIAININAGVDEDKDVWVTSILYIASALDRAIENHPRFLSTLKGNDSREAKLRRLIQHPATQPPEREAAEAALYRIGAHMSPVTLSDLTSAAIKDAKERG